ncbi:PIN domain-containing protein [Candidatus Spongiisocius sp.]|uniref:PIN domain-containing protein n=1 Tax=Candidatus Spongiisocius sp. TaxID=3101273 RepID=UPI003B5AD8D2
MVGGVGGRIGRDLLGDSDPGGKEQTGLGCDAARWRSDRIADGLRELPLHGTEAVRAVALEREGFHRDPADRFIVATALLGGHTLLTTDREIITWPGELHCVDVRRPRIGR